MFELLQVLATDRVKLSPRQEKMVEYMRNAASVGLTYFLFVTLFGYPGEIRKKMKIDTSLES
jgi:hypothetical protein